MFLFLSQCLPLHPFLSPFSFLCLSVSVFMCLCVSPSVPYSDGLSHLLLSAPSSLLTPHCSPLQGERTRQLSSELCEELP